MKEKKGVAMGISGLNGHCKGFRCLSARFWVLGFIGTVFFLHPFVYAQSQIKASDDTMLMFVGEDLSVVTVASRRPESPAAAPAVTRVVDRKEIEEKGYETLGELLADEPGFYMAFEARGTVPYLRGVPDGILFLYDGVPVTMDVTKNLHPLDRELPLTNIQRVEIVRGPGSVLWGPDAFAGIVNIVPMRGWSKSGAKAGLLGGSNNTKGAYLNWGMSGDGWDAFLSGYGARERFHDDSYIVAKPIGTSDGSLHEEERIDPSHYLELTGNLHVGDWLSISGRLSQFKRKYTMQDPGDLSWAGERESPISYLKATLTKTLGPSHFSLTGYFEDIRYKVTDVDLAREQKNQIFHGEFLWDRRIGSKGLLTMGLSYRDNRVDGALVNDGFLPDFLKPTNVIFVPTIDQENYDNSLKSVFAQYRQRFWGIDWWLGGRVDDHSQYRSSLSYSLGMNWPFLEDWRLKAVLGTAYRSPYSSQLFAGKSFDPEEINTANAELSWTVKSYGSLSLSAFCSRLKDHINEDPYGGLSEPGDETIAGFELSCRSKVSRAFEIFANLTHIRTWGDGEDYRAFKYAFIRPDGTKEEVFDAWEQPIDAGPEWIANVGATYRFSQKKSLSLLARKTSRVPYSFSKDVINGYYDQPLIVNLTVNLKDFPLKNSELTVGGKNILDQEYWVPGVYGPVEGMPFSIFAVWSLRF